MEKNLSSMDQPFKPEDIATQNNGKNDEKEQQPFDLEEEKVAVKERDESELSEVRASLGLEKNKKAKSPRKYLQSYLELEEDAVERIELIKAGDLSENYQSQYEEFQDGRLGDINIAIVPDDLWVKGSQPSESSAEENMILIRQGYFENTENIDEASWMTHELAHCQSMFDSKDEEEYQENMQTKAFEDLAVDTYPNNLVEQHAFTKQFQSLKKQGKSREDIIEILSGDYSDEDTPFFDRLLDEVYS